MISAAAHGLGVRLEPAEDVRAAGFIRTGAAGLVEDHHPHRAGRRAGPASSPPSAPARHQTRSRSIATTALSACATSSISSPVRTLSVAPRSPWAMVRAAEAMATQRAHRHERRHEAQQHHHRERHRGGVAQHRLDRPDAVALDAVDALRQAGHGERRARVAESASRRRACDARWWRSPARRRPCPTRGPRVPPGGPRGWAGRHRGARSPPAPRPTARARSPASRWRGETPPPARRAPPADRS